VIWVGDALLRRIGLVDGDTGAFLGQLPGGMGIISPHRSVDGRLFFMAETHYTRTTRGARSDVVSITDAKTLAPISEIAIPPKRSEHVSWLAGSALSDDGRFLAVFNLNPATSISVVDLAEQRVAAEVEIPGCGLVYAAGPRRFFSLCADGSALVLALDERGGVASKAKTEAFFDPNTDPVIEKPVRRGEVWYFVSFAGVVHPIDVSGSLLRFEETWRLVGDAERAAEWRPGGMQPFAIHAPSGRLYALMNQHGPDAHREPGRDVWVFDVDKRERVAAFALRSPVASFVLEQAQSEPGGALDWILQGVAPNEGVERILVTQDATPVLFAGSGFPPTLAVYDAVSGTHRRDLHEVGIMAGLLQLP
jgi:methylamine dehydrogenase heavy chain